MQIISKNTVNSNNNSFSLLSEFVELDDLLLAFISTGGKNNGISSIGTDWQQSVKKTIGNITSEIWYKKADVNDVGNKTHTFKTISGDHHTASMIVIRGANKISPIGLVSSSPTFTAPSIKVDNDSFVFRHHTSQSGFLFDSPPYEIVSNLRNISNASSLVYYSKDENGFSKSQSVTGSGTTESIPNISFTIEIKKQADINEQTKDKSIITIGNSNHNSTGGNNEIIMSIPALTTPKDVMVAFFSMDGSPCTITSAPTGWIKKISDYNPSDHLSAEIWYKIANTSDTPGMNVKFSISESEQRTATLVTFRNINNTNPFGEIKTSYSAVAPSINISKNGNFLVTYHTIHAGVTLNTPLEMNLISAVENPQYASSIVSYEKRNVGITGEKISGGQLALSIELIYEEINEAPLKPKSFIEPVNSKQKGTNIKVEWGKSIDPNSDKIVYQLEYQYDSSGWNIFSDNLDVESVNFAIENTAATTMQFRVIAKDTFGLISEYTYSNVIDLLVSNKNPNIVPQFNMKFNSVVKGEKYIIDWTSSIDEDHDSVSYQLEVKIDNEDYTIIASGIAENSVTYLVPLTDISDIKFRVKSTDSRGLSSGFIESNSLNVIERIKVPGPFQKPNIFILSRGTRYDVQWGSSEDYDVDNNTSYDLEFSYDNVHFSRLINTIHHESVFLTPSNNNYKSVWFRVRTKDENRVSDYVYSPQYLLNSRPNKPVWIYPASDITLKPGSKVILSWSAVDPDKDLLSYDLYASYDDGPRQIIFADIQKNTAEFIINNNFLRGNVKFSVIAKDGKGLVSEISESAVITAQSAPRSPIIALSPTTWTNGEVVVKIENGADTGGGIFGSEYRIDSGVWQAYTKPFTISKEGETTVEARTIDKSFFTSIISLKTARIDKTKPTKPTLAVNTSEWTNLDVVVSISGGDDDRSGILRSEYKINDGEWRTYNANNSFVSVEGISTIYARNIDMAGNASDIVSEIIKISKTRPSKPTIVLTNTNWTKDDVDFTLTLSNNSLSAIKHHEYKIANGPWRIYTGKATVNTNGIIQVFARAVDEAGNYSYEDVATVKIDRTPPLKPVIRLSNSGWSNKDVSFTIEHGKDELSGPMRSEFRIDDGVWQEYSRSINISKDRLTTVYARTFDLMNNVSIVSSVVIKIDRTNPTPPTIVANKVDWTKDNVTVTISGGTDPLSDIERVEYKINDGIWKTYYPPLIISSSGQQRIYARNVDGAGNKSTEVYTDVKIDKEIPNSPIIVLDHNSWTNTDINVKIEVNNSESLSGIRAINYKIGNGSWNVYHGEFSISTEGQNTIYARVIDNVNNVSIESTKTFMIDKTNPSKPTVNLSDNKWTDGDVTCTIVNGNDNLSGIKETQFKIGLNDEWKKYDNEFTISSKGANAILARTMDNAGNISDISYSISKIDSDIPKGDIIINDGKGIIDGLTNSVKLTLTGFDSNSGITEFMVSNLKDFSNAIWQKIDHRIKAIIRTTGSLHSATGVVTDSTKFARFFNEVELEVAYHSTLYLDNIDWINTISASLTGTYSVEHVGYFKVPVSGNYEFGISSGDASELWINDTLITSLYSNSTMSNGFVKKNSISLTANKEYKLVFKMLKNTLNSGARLGIKRPIDNNMFVAPPELFFKESLQHTINDWDITPELGIKTVYAKFRDAIENESTIYSDGIIKADFPSGTIMSPISQTGYLINQKPKIVIMYNLADQATTTDFKIQVSDDEDFNTIIYEDIATTTLNTGWGGITATVDNTKIYTPTIDFGIGIKYIRVAIKDATDWGVWSDTVEIEIKSPDWSDVINDNSLGVKVEWIQELREKMYPIKSARGMSYYQTFKRKNFINNEITLDNSLDKVQVTTDNINPYIDMYNLGEFSPSKYRYFIIKYRVVSGTLGTKPSLFYCNNLHQSFGVSAPDTQKIEIPIVNNNEWQTVYIDAWENTGWKENGSVTGWRLSFGDAENVVYEIDYLSLVENLADIKSEDIVNNVTPVRMVHLTELRSGFIEIAKSLNETVSWTDPEIQVGTTQRKGKHWSELRIQAEKS